MKNNKQMQHFFYNDTFCSNLGDLAEILNIDEDNVNELKDNWHVEVELSELEPIFKVDAEYLCQLLADANEDRLSDVFGEEEVVLKALKESIDFDKLRDSLPKFYYPNNQFELVIKEDLIEWFDARQ